MDVNVQIRPAKIVVGDFFRYMLNWKLYAAILVTSLVSYAISFIAYEINLLPFDIRLIAPFLATAALLSALVCFFLFIAARLQLISVTSNIEREHQQNERTAYIDERLTALQDHVDAITARNLDQTSDFIANMGPEFERLVNLYFETKVFEVFESKIQDKYGENINSDIKLRSIRSIYERSIDGMSAQLIKQRTNSNTNLFLGLVFATIGIAVLGYVFYFGYINNDRATNNTDITAFILGFIPRVTFVILVETVAFFFLSLYREDRNMIRYFRNEITNFEAKFLALEASARFGDKGSMSKAIGVFTTMERNFMIRKGDKLVTEAIKENDERLFDKFIDKLSNNFDLSKLRK